jgi:hypothetical protein
MRCGLWFEVPAKRAGDFGRSSRVFGQTRTDSEKNFSIVVGSKLTSCRGAQVPPRSKRLSARDRTRGSGRRADRLGFRFLSDCMSNPSLKGSILPRWTDRVDGCACIRGKCFPRREQARELLIPISSPFRNLTRVEGGSLGGRPGPESPFHCSARGDPISRRDLTALVRLARAPKSLLLPDNHAAPFVFKRNLRDRKCLRPTAGSRSRPERDESKRSRPLHCSQTNPWDACKRTF